MFRTRIFSLLAALLCFAGMAIPVTAAEVDSGSVYCFTPEDFSGEEPIAGICITSLPEPESGSVMLGSRVLRPGDILTAEQVAQMTFCAPGTGEDRTAEVGYLPIYSGRVDSSAAMTISIRGKEDKAPIAEDFALETYKNLPVTGSLKVTDPEGQTMTYTVTRQPKRGTLTIAGDGSFTYTPSKNKVGVDSFVYTAADPAGKVSREATVTVTILKPTDATQYTDTVGRDCRFAAEWMKNTGIFVGENLAGQSCFLPDREVSRGEFVTMLTKALELPVREDVTYTGYTDEIPGWLRPYLAAAVRSGLTAGLPEQKVFDAAAPVSGAEAAVMLRNALDLTLQPAAASEEAADPDAATIPVWAQTALEAVTRQGLALEADDHLTRGQTAELLYQCVRIHAGNQTNRFETEQ